METTISQDKLNEISTNIISSIEKFMAECDVSVAKSAVKFWMCTSPNPVSGKGAAPAAAIRAAEDLRLLTFTNELISAVKEHGIEVEYIVMYKLYDHFYKGYDPKEGGQNAGCIFAGGFHRDLFNAKAEGKEIKNITKSW